MLNSTEPLSHSQISCWSCEELVHSMATQCPYCKANLQHAAKATHVVSSSDKITPLPAISLPQEDSSLLEDTQSESLGKQFLTLCFLLGGCNCLFLGILIGLFSRDGSFTLSWPESRWPLYFGTGIIAVFIGLFTMKSFDKRE